VSRMWSGALGVAPTLRSEQSTRLPVTSQLRKHACHGAPDLLKQGMPQFEPQLPPIACPRMVRQLADRQAQLQVERDEGEPHMLAVEMSR